MGKLGKRKGKKTKLGSKGSYTTEKATEKVSRKCVG